ncbi:MAG: hypothetical protein ACRYFK_20025 [Janthinobacterium lividum]
MSVTRLKRKHRKNIARANNETKKIKDLLRTPVLKNVDLDELKSRFGQAAPEEKKPEPSVAAPAATENQQPEAKPAGLFDKVAHAASAAAAAVKHAATDAADAVAHSSVVEKAKEVATQAVDAVTHSAAFEAAQQAAHNVVEGTKQVLSNSEQPAPEAASTEEPAKNDEAKVNETGTEGFDEAEAVTKPVTEDGQPGEHPKPEIEL